MSSTHSRSPPHDPVHDPADHEETVVNPEEPYGHAGRSAAPNTGNKTSKLMVNFGNLDVSDSLHQMFKCPNAQNKLMLTKLIKRVDDHMSVSKSKSRVPPSRVPASGSQDLLGEPQDQMLASDDDDDEDDEDAYNDDDVNQDVSDNDDGSNQSEILYTYPQETESFLVDTEFLPKSAKQERARNSLFQAVGSDSPKKVDSTKPVSEEKSMLEKFLDSIPDKTSSSKKKRLRAHIR